MFLQFYCGKSQKMLGLLWMSFCVGTPIKNQCRAVFQRGEVVQLLFHLGIAGLGNPGTPKAY